MISAKRAGRDSKARALALQPVHEALQLGGEAERLLRLPPGETEGGIAPGDEAGGGRDGGRRGGGRSRSASAPAAPCGPCGPRFGSVRTNLCGLGRLRERGRRGGEEELVGVRLAQGERAGQEERAEPRLGDQQPVEGLAGPAWSAGGAPYRSGRRPGGGQAGRGPRPRGRAARGGWCRGERLTGRRGSGRSFALRHRPPPPRGGGR